MKQFLKDVITAPVLLCKGVLTKDFIQYSKTSSWVITVGVLIGLMGIELAKYINSVVLSEPLFKTLGFTLSLIPSMVFVWYTLKHVPKESINYNSSDSKNRRKHF